jgi:GTP cyclohydrolase FolE2
MAGMVKDATEAQGVQTFERLMGADPALTLASMDAAGDDVANTSPTVAIRIGNVGMRRHDVVVSVRDPFDDRREGQAVCTVDLAASVPVTHRGLHLSRIGDELAKSAGARYADVVDYSATLARSIASRQYGEAAVTVWARVPYVETLPARAGGEPKQSLEHLETMARTTVTARRSTTNVAIRVRHMVACPCVQNTYLHALRVKNGGTSPDMPSGPLLTHSQRCITTITLRRIAGAWPVSEALAALDGVLVRTRNTLSREHELVCVYRAHARPQFIEDALRSATVAVLRALGPGTTVGGLSARARCLESIHEFDLRASLALGPGACAALRRRAAATSDNPIPPLAGSL